MKTDKTSTYSPAHYFAALKLIEQLLDKETAMKISEAVIYSQY